MDFISDPDLWNNLGVVGVLAITALLVITDKLVWHTRLKAVEARVKNAEEREERWQRVALDALAGPAQAGVKAAEATVNAVSALPDPRRGESDVPV